MTFVFIGFLVASIFPLAAVVFPLKSLFPFKDTHQECERRRMKAFFSNTGEINRKLRK